MKEVLILFKIDKEFLMIDYDGLNTNVTTTYGDVVFRGNNIKNILNESCISYGSSLNGRIKGSKWALKSKYKLPIVVSEKEKLVFFPVKEMGREIWVNFDMIKEVKKNKNVVKVEFKNGLKVDINVSYTIFNNQVLKASRLWIIFLT